MSVRYYPENPDPRRAMLEALAARDDRAPVFDARTLIPRGELRQLPLPESLLLVGELNPYGACADYALYPSPEGSAGERLGRILELSLAQQVGAWRANLCRGAWSIRQARASARRLLAGPWTTHLLLGVKVRGAYAGALGLRERALDALRDRLTVGEVRWELPTGHRLALDDVAADGLISVWRVGGDATRADRVLISAPHPSGLCRHWNKPGVAEATREVFRRWALSITEFRK